MTHWVIRIDGVIWREYTDKGFATKIFNRIRGDVYEYVALVEITVSEKTLDSKGA